MKSPDRVEMNHNEPAELSGLRRQRWRMLLSADPTCVVGPQRSQKLLSGKIRPSGKNDFQKVLEHRLVPCGLVLTGFEPGVIGEQERFKLAIHLRSELEVGGQQVAGFGGGHRAVAQFPGFLQLRQACFHQLRCPTIHELRVRRRRVQHPAQRQKTS